ncbi:uncharacterized protein Gasu_28570 [Galdieria sulphuraria]|uniref:N-acetylgalactosaminide beta-1,3-galactosyltransferase n=1 Tax=Galdieria sulphuraria TaxID=130081 RepID=M2W2F8_GALSU|nr:uncharacterized protein Gasu_28570 [Galdieria sulphuraria]EME29861.1 hypothetical protein Gasu_28570 [Galdieria sulphuraria]|eukprot:XP_005706381.1 hypothetical protein Gasu_28570 [Galdieria sulphuraria]
MRDAFQEGFLKRQSIPCNQNNFEVKIVSSVPFGEEQLKRTSNLQGFFLHSVSWIIIILLVFAGGFYLGYAGVWLSSSLQVSSPDAHTDSQEVHTFQLPKETSEEDKRTDNSQIIVEYEEIFHQGNNNEHDNNRLWEQIAPKVAVAVKTGKGVWNSRILAHMKTWWKRIPNKIIISDWSEPSNGIIGLEQMVDKDLREELGISRLLRDIRDEDTPVFFGEVSDSFRLDSEKNLPGLVTLYNTFPDAEWYIMIDDDTFIFLDNLAQFLLEYSSNISSPLDVPFYFGNPFSVGIPSNNETWEDEEKSSSASISFAHGGSGILLSSKALKTIVPHIPWCMKKWQGCPHGDARVALYALKFSSIFQAKKYLFQSNTDHSSSYRGRHCG